MGSASGIRQAIGSTHLIGAPMDIRRMELDADQAMDGAEAEVAAEGVAEAGGKEDSQIKLIRDQRRLVRVFVLTCGLKTMRHVSFRGWN